MDGVLFWYLLCWTALVSHASIRIVCSFDFLAWKVTNRFIFIMFIYSYIGSLQKTYWDMYKWTKIYQFWTLWFCRPHECGRGGSQVSHSYLWSSFLLSSEILARFSPLWQKIPGFQGGWRFGKTSVHVTISIKIHVISSLNFECFLWWF